MPPAETPPNLADVVAELKAIREAAERAASPLPLLLSHDEAASYLGTSKAGWFRLLAAGLVAVVDVPGSGPRVRRADLEKLTERLKPRRKARRIASVHTPAASD